MSLDTFLKEVVRDNHKHGKWLNTLSMMENAGARKISRCEHPVFVSEIILKHASEESRHAYYLKKQIAKVAEGEFRTYERKNVYAPAISMYYLHQLDIEVCRYLRTVHHKEGADLKYAAYLLVTYAIEVRADALYPAYQQALDEVGSKVNVKSIIMEEIGHLAEMRKQISETFSEPEEVEASVCLMEQALYEQWVRAFVSEAL